MTKTVPIAEAAASLANILDIPPPDGESSPEFRLSSARYYRINQLKETLLRFAKNGELKIRYPDGGYRPEGTEVSESSQVTLAEAQAALEANGEEFVAEGVVTSPSGASEKSMPTLPVGIPSDEIIEKFRLSKEWREKLRKPSHYSFLSPPVLAQRGKRGGESHRWNPARFGIMLIARKERNERAVLEVIHRHFTEYSDELDSILASNQ